MMILTKFINLVLKLLACLPLSWLRAGGRCLGRMLQRLDKRHRAIVRDNLRLAFPEQTEAWIDATATACFEHLGMVISELPYLAAAPLSKLMALTRFHNLERFQQAQQQDLGAFSLTGHIGNWEWCSVAIGAAGYTGLIVVRPLDNKALDQVVTAWRERSGQKVVAKSAPARGLVRQIRGGGKVGILLDQNMDWYDGPWVEFFNRPACTNQGLALLAMLSKAPVMTLHCFRADDGCFDVWIGEPIALAQSGDRTKDVWQNTQNYTWALEKIIREKPEQWLWLHRRWKTLNYCPWPMVD